MTSEIFGIQGQDSNIIHANAFARKKALSKFGTDLRHYHALNEKNVIFKDLRRSKVLVGTTGVTAYRTGLIDFAVNINTGYISDVVKEIGSLTPHASDYNADSWQAFKMPAGVWNGIELFKRGGGTPSDVDVYIASPGLNPELSAPQDRAVLTLLSQGAGTADGNAFTVTLPFNFVAQTSEFWVYLKLDGSIQLARYATGGQNTSYIWNSTTDEWDDINDTSTDTLYSEMQGADAENFVAQDKFTIGLVIDVDQSPGGGSAYVIANATEYLARIYVNSNHTLEAKVKNTNGTTYTLNYTKGLHPGKNLITLSYEKNVSVKFGINGVVEASTTPSDYDVFSTADHAFGVGCYMKADSSKTVVEELAGAVISDVFFADEVLTDDALWDLFKAYITAIPVSLMDDVAVLDA